MKRFWMLLVVAVTCLSLFSSLAEAKRFGGGSSFGKNRPAPTKQMQREPEATPRPAQGSGASKWMGPLAGLAIGAGLATLFTGGGLGEFGSAMGSILMVVAVAVGLMFLFARLRKPQAASMQYAGAGHAPTRFNSEIPLSQGGSGAQLLTVPHDFPRDSFLRNAKASFIRLQAANDRKDVNDVREYTTPEVFAEISLQMQERGDAVQHTEVVSLAAELLEVAHEGDYTIASVRFSGQLRESQGPLEAVEEVWHIQQAAHDAQAKWLLAGIQQIA